MTEDPPFMQPPPEQKQAEDSAPPHPSFVEAVRVWVKIGLLSFGGPAGQIALMHHELVEKRRWLSEHRFLHALNYCMLLPGPEAQQLSVYAGWLLHKTRGGLIAGALFVLPGALLMWLISCIYVFYGKLPWMEAVFYGLKAAVMAIVVSALWKIAGKVLRHPAMWGLAAVSFVAIFVLGAPFPLVVLGALGIGLLLGRRFPRVFSQVAGHGVGKADEAGSYVIAESISAKIPVPTVLGTMGRILTWVGIWLLPLAAVMIALGPTHVLASEGLFFSKASLVTFGGAYAVLPYVGQQAVEVHGWLDAGQMMDGLALAETTPGPLILVLQFVGFLGGWNAAGDMPPLVMATLAAGLTTWCTFVPGYLFIFAGAPFIEHGRGNQRFQPAMAAVSAAVVGVLLNLAVWFAWHLVVPKPGTIDPIPPILAAGFFFLLWRRKWGVIPIVGLGAAAGLVMHFAGIV